MSPRHPYVGQPDRQFWKKDPGVSTPRSFDPVSTLPFKLTRSDKIITAGSCFAQHIARVLSEENFTHFIAETPHPMVSESLAKKHNYGLFSARYGNIYTARQLRQLFERAYGLFEPIASGWEMRDGSGVVDPFRPQIQPGGYRTQVELDLDRKQHLKAVRTALESADVFVFTLGLTECWSDTRDGAVFPIAPGVAGGTYDPTTTEFKNFDETETYADLHAALEFARSKNPSLRIILTVSPVPLNATFEPRHVALSTTWSKAVLRIAAEKATKAFDNCMYFPSYEVITSPQTRSRYYAEDRREVTDQGVKHVMGLFFKHVTDDKPRRQSAAGKERGDRRVKPRLSGPNDRLHPGENQKNKQARSEVNRPLARAKGSTKHEEHAAKVEALNALLCDEDLLDNSE